MEMGVESINWYQIQKSLSYGDYKNAVLENKAHHVEKSLQFAWEIGVCERYSTILGRFGNNLQG
jgi:hypothetical protein